MTTWALMHPSPCTRARVLSSVFFQHPILPCALQAGNDEEQQIDLEVCLEAALQAWHKQVGEAEAVWKL